MESLINYLVNSIEKMESLTLATACGQVVLLVLCLLILRRVSRIK